MMRNIYNTYMDILNNKQPKHTNKNIYNTYLNIIKEADEQGEKKPEQKKVPEVKKPEQKKQDKKAEADLKFSVDLATEFSNTINQFTVVCSKIVQNRMVDKETSDTVYNLMGKIKDLLDAAGKTE